MSKPSHQPPDGAMTIHTFAGLREVLQAFAKGSASLIVLMGSPGLCKTQNVERALRDTNAFFVNGYRTPLQLYKDLYRCRNKLVVLDDAYHLLKNSGTRDLVLKLTETTRTKRIEYGSTTAKLKLDDSEYEHIPMSFTTRSRVCLVTNSWMHCNSVFQAIQSRADFYHLDPTGVELHMHVSEFFPDQEIFNHVQERLHLLREPDARIYMRALHHKEANMVIHPWQDVIKAHCDDDDINERLRELLQQHANAIPNQLWNLFIADSNIPAELKMARSTFYERVKRIRKMMPTEPLGVIKVKGRPRTDVDVGDVVLTPKGNAKVSKQFWHEEGKYFYYKVTFENGTEDLFHEWDLKPSGTS
jgi:hypothetical protein